MLTSGRQSYMYIYKIPLRDLTSGLIQTVYTPSELEQPVSGQNPELVYSPKYLLAVHTDRHAKQKPFRSSRALSTVWGLHRLREVTFLSFPTASLMSILYSMTTACIK